MGHARGNSAGSLSSSNVNQRQKPSIVFAHGLWVDGSCFSKLIPTLQAEGHEVMAFLRPSCAISSVSTGTSLALALRLGPSILFTQAFSRCQCCSRFSALFITEIVILRRSRWPLRQFHND